MNTNQVPNLAADSTASGWRIEWWGLLRGVLLLLSALACVTALYYVILTISRG